MRSTQRAELVWYREGRDIHLYVRPQGGDPFSQAERVRVSNLLVPVWRRSFDRAQVVFRHPVELTETADGWVAAPVFAILAGAGRAPFVGNRDEFRDLLRTARAHRRFTYILPADRVDTTDVWTGYVRLGVRRWVALPCPQPQAVYNRIPLRTVERAEASVLAKRRLRLFGIPYFNPDYFNKATLYDWIRHSSQAQALPETSSDFQARRLADLLSRHRGVYLKPAGGSIGHGILRVRRTQGMYEVIGVRKGQLETAVLGTLSEVWKTVKSWRAPGAYVLQAAVESIEWRGRPCDFRVLLQKYSGQWHLVGVGVRVAGQGAITTHVPNGGTVERADRVLQTAFGSAAARVRRALDSTAIQLAHVIDDRYDLRLGEMSMDLAVDREGRVWFLEANSKPMKFDESDIWERALQGVLRHLEELADGAGRTIGDE